MYVCRVFETVDAQMHPKLLSRSVYLHTHSISRYTCTLYSIGFTSIHINFVYVVCTYNVHVYVHVDAWMDGWMDNTM